jgi:lipopolysaccharide export system permease protein
MHLGELAWRIGLALAALNFVVIAVAASSVNPRAGAVAT